MAQKPVPREILQQSVDAFAQTGSQLKAADLLGISRSTLQHRLLNAKLAGLSATDNSEKLAQEPEADGPPRVDSIALRRLLRSSRVTLDQLAERLGATRGGVLDALDALHLEGFAVHRADDHYWLDTKPQAATDRGLRHEYRSRQDGSYIFGFTSDNHLGSKYARQDCLGWLFERFAEVGVDRVLNAGNWIDGEANFNKHDLVVHGMHQQCVHLAQRWPSIPGVVTYAVAGDDHEGWYSQREGVDIGRYAEQCFRDEGRDDWVDLGYMEADIALIHARTGVSTRLRVAHPGGGSAYAHSYAPQKYMESLSSGEKPAVVLLGHWHKLSVNNIRGSWVIQTGCTQDQTPFGRKKRLDFHVGGGICRLQQDPETGAIVSCTVEMLQFFNREYYGTGRWSHSENVRMAERASRA